MTIPPIRSAIRNRLLSALSSEASSRFLSGLQLVSLPLRTTLARPGMPIDAIYFVESGWISMVAVMEDGGQAEVGLIGREGMFGAFLVGGVDSCYADTYVQAKVTALQMDARAFQHEIEDQPELRRLLFRYGEAIHAQTMQTAACNGHHVLRQRFARWLLMAHDRADGDELPLTQEFLSLMLCVRRSSVSETARPFQEAGAIRYSRGNIILVDRGFLEKAACDCYRAVQARFEQLLYKIYQPD